LYPPPPLLLFCGKPYIFSLLKGKINQGLNG
jgi:hypothetical protein